MSHDKSTFFGKYHLSKCHRILMMKFYQRQPDAIMNFQYMNKHFQDIFKNNHRYYCSGYNIEFYKYFFLLFIIWKRKKFLTVDCCTFCKEKSESTQHEFLNCMHIVPVCSKLSMHIFLKMGIFFRFYNALIEKKPIIYHIHSYYNWTF